MKDARVSLDAPRLVRYFSEVTATHRLTLPVQKPFSLDVALNGHGWVMLPPHQWEGPGHPWHTVLHLHGATCKATIQGRGDGLAVSLQSVRRLTAKHIAEARRQLAHMLRLDEDLQPFWTLCRQHPHLHWIARRGGGRLLRGPTVFEDLLKLLFTTNCTWTQTTAMTRNLLQAIGTEAPAGARGFPTAAECARGEAFYRDTVRTGYRARACQALASSFANGTLTDAQFLDPEQSTADLRRRLLALDGFGPYAAGQALRLLGHYDDLALDSWCRARLKALLGRKQPPTDKAITRRSKPFGRWAGLALWCELTAEWHGEKPQEEDAGKANASWW